MNHRWSLSVLAALFVGLAAGPLVGAELFEPMPVATAGGNPRFRVNLAAFSGVGPAGESRLGVTALGLGAPAASLRRAAISPQRGAVYAGVLADQPGASRIFLTVSNSRLAGRIVDGARSWLIVPVAADTVELRAAGADLPCATGSAQRVALPDAPVPAVPDVEVAAGEVTLDLLVVYTPAVVAQFGGEPNFLASLDGFVNEANESLANSLVDHRFRLRHTALVDYTEASDGNDIITDLNALTGTADGQMDSVHALRTSVGADFVCMIAINHQYGGVANLLAPMSLAYAPYAFSVVSVLGLENLSFPHELGHGLGCQHDVEHSGGDPGNYAYSYGLEFQGAADSVWYRTIMAYNGRAGTPEDPQSIRIPYFSTPLISHQGTVIGDAAAADNARTIRQTAPTAANFRAAVAINHPPTANPDDWQVSQATTLTVPARGVLANDTDPDAHALTAVLVTPPANGTLTLSTNGGFTYRPADTFVGNDTFTYRASDGKLTSDPATVTIGVIETRTFLVYRAHLRSQTRGNDDETYASRYLYLVYRLVGPDYLLQGQIDVQRTLADRHYWRTDGPDPALTVGTLTDTGSATPVVYLQDFAGDDTSYAGWLAWGSVSKPAINPNLSPAVPLVLTGKIVGADFSAATVTEGRVLVRLDLLRSTRANTLLQTADDILDELEATLVNQGYTTPE